MNNVNLEVDILNYTITYLASENVKGNTEEETNKVKS